MKVVEKQIKELIEAEYNPRMLTEVQYRQLKDSLLRFGVVDPVLVNVNKERKNIIIGGHQRTKVWRDLGNNTIPCVELDLTLDQEKELNIRLNKNTGKFDFDMLANYFDQDELIEWGFNDDDFGILDDILEDVDNKEKEEEGEVQFSEFLNESNNYVVIIFKNDLDWLSAQNHFNLKTVSAKRSNGKEWSKGVGRVIDGAKYLDKLRDEQK